MRRTPFKDGGRPNGFYDAVKEKLGVNVQASSGYICMVKSGRRTNDAILRAVIEADHDWKNIQHERLKKGL